MRAPPFASHKGIFLAIFIDILSSYLSITVAQAYPRAIGTAKTHLAVVGPTWLLAQSIGAD